MHSIRSSLTRTFTASASRYFHPRTSSSTFRTFRTSAAAMSDKSEILTAYEVRLADIVVDAC